MLFTGSRRGAEALPPNLDTSGRKDRIDAQ
jgi:hypothetical protein